jgi:hypothetical protein
MIFRAHVPADCSVPLGCTPSTSSTRLPVLTFLRPLLASALILVCSAAGCSGMAAESAAVPQRLDEVLRWEGNLTLQEPPGVITVLPVVRFDSGGGFLIADLSETEIRRYTANGQLLDRFGGAGLGPGEFEALAAADRAGDRIYAADRGGRIWAFHPDGRPDTLVYVPLSPIYDMQTINDSTMLLTGRLLNDPESRLIHIWDRKRNAILNSFFPVPPHDRELDDAYRYAGHPTASIRGDQIVANFALSDTLYFFSLDGREQGKLPLRFRNYRPLRRPPPNDTTTASRVAWSEHFSRVAQVFWSSDNTFYVHYYDMKGTQPQWHLLRVNRQGTPLFEIEESPRMLAVSPTERQLYFINPQTELPNQWSVAIAAH